MGTERVDHGLDVVQDLSDRHGFVHQHAHAVIVAQTTGDAQGEGAVRLGLEAHVTEGAVDRVVHAVAEGDFQFPGHVDIPADGQQILGCRLRPGHHVKGLSGLYAAQRAAHDVAGIVSAAALTENVTADGLRHQRRHLLSGQVVKLHSLAGGQLQLPDIIALHRFRQKLQPLQRQTAACHPQAQHVFGGIFLCVGTHPAGDALIGFFVQLSLLKGADGVCKRSDLFPESLNPLFVHHNDPTSFSRSPLSAADSSQEKRTFYIQYTTPSYGAAIPNPVAWRKRPSFFWKPCALYP